MAKKKSKTETAAPEWDVIVIGTGMGGCAAGAICALNGLKTLILEKNQRPGGSCSYYEKEGFQVDAGTHLFIRGNKGPFGALTRRLGMGEPLEFLHTDPVTHLRGLNMDIAIPANPFKIPQFLLQFIWQADIPFFEYPKILWMFKDILLMKENQIDELDDISVEEFMMRYTDNPQTLSIIGFLLGLYFILPTWEASAGESIWNLQKMARDMNLGYPKGGCISIPRTFLAGAEKHGAILRLNSGVAKIDVKSGQVTGVVTKSGERITARAVISTSSAKDTVARLAGKRHFPASYLERIQALKPSLTATQAKIGVRKKLVKAGSIVGGWPIKLDGKIENDQMKANYAQMASGQLGDFVSIYTPVPTNYDPDLAPEGCQLLTVVAGAPTLETDYIDPEKEWVKRMVDAINNLVPGLQENTIFRDTFTVTALANWIGKSNGSAISTGQAMGQVRNTRPPHETPVKGLYLAGDCAGPARGVGTELACQSGMDCGDLVARDLSFAIID